VAPIVTEMTHLFMDGPLTEELWHKALETAGTRIGFFSKMREVVALLVVSSWQDLFEILTFQVLLARAPSRPP